VYLKLGLCSVAFRFGPVCDQDKGLGTHRPFLRGTVLGFYLPPGKAGAPIEIEDQNRIRLILRLHCRDHGEWEGLAWQWIVDTGHGSSAIDALLDNRVDLAGDDRLEYRITEPGIVDGLTRSSRGLEFDGDVCPEMHGVLQQQPHGFMGRQGGGPIQMRDRVIVVHPCSGGRFTFVEGSGPRVVEEKEGNETEAGNDERQNPDRTRE